MKKIVKMSKRILAVITIAAVVLLGNQGAGTSEIFAQELVNENEDLTAEILEEEMEDPIAEIGEEETEEDSPGVISESPVNGQEETAEAAPAEFMVMSAPIGATATANDLDELKDIISGAAEDMVIELSSEININATTSLENTSGYNITITPSGNKRHFAISGTDVELTLTNIVLDGGGIGGGIRSSAVKFTLIGGVIQNCQGSMGGGIYASDELNITGGAVITKNSSTGNGGGVYAKTSLNLNDSQIIDNKSGDNGGGAYVVTDFQMENSEIIENESVNSGGGVYVLGNADLISGEIRGNQTSTSGGGVYVKGTFTNTDAKINNNTVEGGKGDWSGGGVYGMSKFYLYGGEINGNSAKKGGGVYISGNTSETYIIAGEINNNEAGNYGGGILIYGALNIEGGSINDNTVTGYAYGGGVYANNTFNMTGGEILRNKAISQELYSGAFGGGVYTDIGGFTMSGGTISENSATGFKEGVYGGGIYIGARGLPIGTGADITISGGTIEDNKAIVGTGYNGTARGGGMYVSDTANNISITNAHISNNEAIGDKLVYGGGIFSQSKNLEIGKDATIEYNTATSREGRSFGGGIYIYHQTQTAAVKDASINGNHAKAESENGYGDGGGIYSRAALDIENSQIHSNTADGDGGGIYAYNLMNMVGGSITENTASKGDGGGIFADDLEEITLDGVEFKLNKAVVSFPWNLDDEGFEDYTALYHQNITNTTPSTPFNNAYNNYDINFTSDDLLPSFVLTYDGNGNTSGAVPNAVTVNVYGETVTIMGNTGNPPLAKKGYSFIGWNDKANGSGVNYAANSSVSLTEPMITLYAQWKLDSTGGGGGGSTGPGDDKDPDYGTETTPGPEPVRPKKESTEPIIKNLILKEDDIPLGQTELGQVTVIDDIEADEIQIEDELIPLGNKKINPKTGYLNENLDKIVGMAVFAAMGFAVIYIRMIRKEENK